MEWNRAVYYESKQEKEVINLIDEMTYVLLKDIIFASLNSCKHSNLFRR